MREMRINYVDGAYTLCNDRGEHVLTLSVGQSFEVRLRGEWCRVRLESGGYGGRYYVTAAGERGRLAMCMQARMCKQVHVEVEATMSLEQARSAWVGKQVESRVPLACGMVRGVVRDITQQEYVVFVYTPRLNTVPVVVSFPLERIGEVLALVAVTV
jgi:Domain of unknown function (DUF5348)